MLAGDEGLPEEEVAARGLRLAADQHSPPVNSLRLLPATSALQRSQSLMRDNGVDSTPATATAAVILVQKANAWESSSSSPVVSCAAALPCPFLTRGPGTVLTNAASQISRATQSRCSRTNTQRFPFRLVNLYQTGCHVSPLHIKYLHPPAGYDSPRSLVGTSVEAGIEDDGKGRCQALAQWLWRSPQTPNSIFVGCSHYAPHLTTSTFFT